jgi:hypothetical protein
MPITLTLTEDQAAELRVILARRLSKLSDLRADASSDAARAVYRVDSTYVLSILVALNNAEKAALDEQDEGTR